MTGGISMPSNGSTWISGKTSSLTLTGFPLSSGSYHPLIRQNTYSGNVVNLGGLGDNWGFYGYYAATTGNQTDWQCIFNSNTGDLSHSRNFSALAFYSSTNYTYNWLPNTSGSHRFTTPSGYVEIGPKNTSWCHFETDKPRFYMGTSLSVNGDIQRYTDSAIFLHTSNYNSYIPTLTGGGASGTWGINISGSASSAPNASNANTYYNLIPGDGNGVKFWSSDSYKISMGASSLYMYGPVTDYSIKMNMDDGSLGRGFTWGRQSYAPIAALNSTTGTLQIAGTFNAVGDVVAYYSDERLKKKTGKIENPIDKVKSLDAFYYINNELANENGYSDTKQQLGLSAQQVKAILPEIVTLAPFDTKTNDDGTTESLSGENYLTVNYAKIVPLLVEAIKEQQTQIELQKKINKDLNKKIKGILEHLNLK